MSLVVWTPLCFAAALADNAVHKGLIPCDGIGHTFSTIWLKMAEQVTCNINTLTFLFIGDRLVYGIPFLRPASENEALSGYFFSELLQTKETRFLVYRCVGHPSRSLPQQPQCSRVKDSSGVHLACQCCSPFTSVWIHNVVFWLWNMKQPWPLPLSPNRRKFSKRVHLVAVSWHTIKFSHGAILKHMQKVT